MCEFQLAIATLSTDKKDNNIICGIMVFYAGMNAIEEASTAFDRNPQYQGPLKASARRLDPCVGEGVHLNP